MTTDHNSSYFQLSAEARSLFHEYSKLLRYDITYDHSWRDRKDLLTLNEKVKKELKELDDISNYQYSKDGIKILDLSSHSFLDKEGSPTWHLEVIKMLWTDGIGLDLDKISCIRWACLVQSLVSPHSDSGKKWQFSWQICLLLDIANGDDARMTRLEHKPRPM